MKNKIILQIFDNFDWGNLLVQYNFWWTHNEQNMRISPPKERNPNLLAPSQK